jgi:hypothetical protein
MALWYSSNGGGRKSTLPPPLDWLVRPFPRLRVKTWVVLCVVALLINWGLGLQSKDDLLPCPTMLSFLGCHQDLTAKEQAYLDRLSTDDRELNELAVAMLPSEFNSETRAGLVTALGGDHCPGLREPVLTALNELMDADHQLTWLHDAIVETMLSPTVPLNGAVEKEVASAVVGAFDKKLAEERTHPGTGIFEGAALETAAKTSFPAMAECT